MVKGTDYFRKIRRMVDELEYLCYKSEFSSNMALDKAITRKKRKINKLLGKVTSVYSSLKINSQDLKFLKENGIRY